VCDGTKVAIFRQHSEQCRRGAGAGPHGGTELAQEQDLGGFARVISGFPIPDAFGVGTAKGCRHGSAKRLRVDGATEFKLGKQHLRGNQ
jgi:hypothetical protein